MAPEFSITPYHLRLTVSYRALENGRGVFRYRGAVWQQHGRTPDRNKRSWPYRQADARLRTGRLDAVDECILYPHADGTLRQQVCTGVRPIHLSDGLPCRTRGVMQLAAWPQRESRERRGHTENSEWWADILGATRRSVVRLLPRGVPVAHHAA